VNNGGRRNPGCQTEKTSGKSQRAGGEKESTNQTLGLSKKRISDCSRPGEEKGTTTGFSPKYWPEPANVSKLRNVKGKKTWTMKRGRHQRN